MAQDMGGIQKGLSGSGVDRTLEAMREIGKDSAREVQQESRDSMKAFLTTPRAPWKGKIRKKQKTIKAQKTRIQKTAKSGEKGKRLLPIAFIKDTANRFQQRNPELKANVLTLLREQIHPDDTPEDIIRKVMEFYPDVTLTDEALEFLLETTEGALHQAVQEAKEQMEERYGREIIAGRNISEEARTASDKGLGTPTSLRDMYRDITGRPRDSNTLFQELSAKYDFKELAKVAKFLLHSLGADLKSKGPSIPHGQLHSLLRETRSLQAILGVYRFFSGRMPLMQKMFKKEGLDIPKKLTFENMSKEFMALARERYPTPDKVLQRAIRLGIDKWILAKIIAFTQLRDAIRQVAINQIFKSVQHRDELHKAVIEALEALEDELEELLEEEEEDEEEWEEDDEWEDEEEEEELTDGR